MDKKELRVLCEDENLYLGDIDVSCVLDMSYLFCEPYVIVRENWNGIEKWDMDTGSQNSIKRLFLKKMAMSLLHPMVL